jgi:agmatine deiminase
LVSISRRKGTLAKKIKVIFMRKRYVPFFLAILGLLFIPAACMNNSGVNKKPANDGKAVQAFPSFPGEFEKQQAMWLQWPSEVYDAGTRPVYPVIINIIKALDPYIGVNLMARSQEEISRIKGLLSAGGYSGNNLRYYVINHQSIWTRDVGPLFVKDSRGRLRVADFVFNNYGRGGSREYIGAEGQVDGQAARLLGLPVIKSDLVSEGGAIESNGRGTMLVTESVALSRNPGLSREQIEKEYKRVLGVKKVVWLKRGLAEDDRITGGHINEIARFAGPDTVLLAQVLPEDRYNNRASQISYLRLEENFRILAGATDQDGRPFRIVRIPMPPSLYGEPDIDGRIPVRSYLNYAVTNGAVLMQTYWRPGRTDALKATEDRVRDILGGVFPGRRIIGIDAENLNRWGGGIHCITQHMPAS